MTETIEAQARAIAEALGWQGFQHPDEGDIWRHVDHGMVLGRPPRLTDGTTLGRAMVADAIAWLSVRADLGIIRLGPMHRIVVGNGNTDAHDAMTFPAALEAAMIKELGL